MRDFSKPKRSSKIQGEFGFPVGRGSPLFELQKKNKKIKRKNWYRFLQKARAQIPRLSPESYPERLPPIPISPDEHQFLINILAKLSNRISLSQSLKRRDFDKLLKCADIAGLTDSLREELRQRRKRYSKVREGGEAESRRPEPKA